MAWIKRLMTVLLLVGGIAFLHYNLPQRDIVQISGTTVKRMPAGGLLGGRSDAGTIETVNRDVRFINTIRANGKPSVYRNEDTDWGWPPYFKFDSSDLDAEAQALARGDEEVWVAITHYGWRIKLISAFPNAIKIKRVDGPNTVLIPWFNIVFLIVLAIILMRVFLWLRKTKEDHIDPIGEKIEDAIDDVRDDIKQTETGIRAFFRRFFGTTKR